LAKNSVTYFMDGPEVTLHHLSKRVTVCCHASKFKAFLSGEVGFRSMVTPNTKSRRFLMSRYPSPEFD